MSTILAPFLSLPMKLLCQQTNVMRALTKEKLRLVFATTLEFFSSSFC